MAATVDTLPGSVHCSPQRMCIVMASYGPTSEGLFILCERTYEKTFISRVFLGFLLLRSLWSVVVRVCRRSATQTANLADGKPEPKLGGSHNGALPFRWLHRIKWYYLRGNFSATHRFWAARTRTYLQHEATDAVSSELLPHNDIREYHDFRA